jgi:dihydrofolate reductase
MRKLKLQMQMSIDGCVTSLDGEPMMAQSGDAELERAIFDELVDTCDTILLGRKMAEQFVKYWEQEAITGTGKPRDFGIKAGSMQKIMFSRTVRRAESKSLKVENGPLADAVNALKRQSGKDIIVYGGVDFVSSLIEHALIDEYHLFVAPTAIGNGRRIFTARTNLKLTASRAYAGGVVVNTYVPKV